MLQLDNLEQQPKTNTGKEYSREQLTVPGQPGTVQHAFAKCIPLYTEDSYKSHGKDVNLTNAKKQMKAIGLMIEDKHDTIHLPFEKDDFVSALFDMMTPLDKWKTDVKDSRDRGDGRAILGNVYEGGKELLQQRMIECLPRKRPREDEEKKETTDNKVLETVLCNKYKFLHVASRYVHADESETKAVLADMVESSNGLPFAEEDFAGAFFRKLDGLLDNAVKEKHYPNASILSRVAVLGEVQLRILMKHA